MMQELELERFTRLVAGVMRIEDMTLGDAKSSYLVRFRGQLIGEDTAALYDRLAEQLKPLNVTPLFRKDKEMHVVHLLGGVINPKPSNAWVNLVLFLLTVASMFIAGTVYTLQGVYQGPAQITMSSLRPYLFESMMGGAGFMAALLSILLAHEFGHYLAGRYHHTHVTLPYFIPFPFGAFGTLGAFIQLKEPPRNRRVLLDIGIAGPLAGLVVAIPVLLLGLSLSQVSVLPRVLPPGSGLQLEGNSILYLLSKYVVFGELLPAPGDYAGVAPWLYWVRYFFTGAPLPLGGKDVLLHPVAWAGWAGLLVTALNLIPAGQLDGGHVLYVLVGKHARRLLPVILVVLGALGFVWPGWWIWAFLIFLLGRMHAEPLDQITPLDPGRRTVALIGLVIFVLVFTPVPILTIGL